MEAANYSHVSLASRLDYPGHRTCPCSDKVFRRRSFVFARGTPNYQKAIGGLGLDLNGRRVRDQPTFQHTRLLSTQANI